VVRGLTCPGCHTELDTIAATGRPDDLFLCSNCYHSWFRFELTEDPGYLSAEPDELDDGDPLISGQFDNA